MSFRDDVILRMIKQLVEALVRLRHVRRERGDAAALDEAGDAVLRWLGLPRALVAASSPATLVELLSPGGALDVEKAHGLARLLEEEATLRAALHDDGGADRCRAQARALSDAARRVDEAAVARFDAAL